MALKETLEAISRKLQQGKYPNEQSISIGIVAPVLAELGWNTTDPDCVWPEYSVKNGRVDFALCYPPQHPRVFVEVKQPGKADGADEQLFEYALRHGVRMALLTDGRTWSFYLPGEEGSYEDRRVYKLDLLERTSEASADSLNRYLAESRIVSGQAIDDAVREIRDRGRTTLATKTIPAAWQSLVDDADPTVTEKLADEVEAKCGVRPEIDAVAKFLKQLGRGLATTVSPASITTPRPAQPITGPATAPGLRRLGYSYREMAGATVILAKMSCWGFFANLPKPIHPFASAVIRTKITVDAAASTLRVIDMRFTAKTKHFVRNTQLNSFQAGSLPQTSLTTQWTKSYAWRAELLEQRPA